MGHEKPADTDENYYVVYGRVFAGRFLCFFYCVSCPFADCS